MMSIYYYGGPENKPLGPCSDEEIRKLADEGEISDETLVRGEGQTNWVRFADWKAARGGSYYAGPDKKPLGPYSAEEMRKLADEGKISDDTFVISEGQKNWVRFADWRAAHETSEAAEAIARKAQQMKTAISTFAFGAMVFGLLLVVLEYFVLPWRLISRSAVTLANWGRARILPTTQSDLPVATFFTIVLRPAVHVMVTVIVGFLVITWGIDLMRDEPKLPTTHLWGTMPGSGSPEQGSVSAGIKFLLGGLCQVYFSNILIGAIFDLISVVVLMANSLRKIEAK